MAATIKKTAPAKHLAPSHTIFFKHDQVTNTHLPSIASIEAQHLARGAGGMFPKVHVGQELAAGAAIVHAHGQQAATVHGQQRGHGDHGQPPAPPGLRCGVGLGG